MGALIALLLSIPFLLPVNEGELKTNQLPYPDSHFMTIEGVDLHYRVLGESLTVPKGNVFFIHGFSASTFSWRKNTNPLVQAGYRVVLVDVPAFGYSDKSTGLNQSLSMRAKIFWQLLNQISKDQWFIAGHSMGGGIASAMAMMHPEQTKGLICVDGVSGSVEAENPSFSFSSFLLGNPVTYRLSEFTLRYFFYSDKRFKSLLQSAYATEPDLESIQGYKTPFGMKNSAAAIMSMSAKSWEIQSLSLTTLNMPVLVVWGSKDSWVPESSGRKFAEKVKQTQWQTIEGAGHCPMETHAEQFNQSILDFILKTSK